MSDEATPATATGQSNGYTQGQEEWEALILDLYIRTSKTDPESFKIFLLEYCNRLEYLQEFFLDFILLSFEEAIDNFQDSRLYAIEEKIAEILGPKPLTIGEVLLDLGINLAIDLITFGFGSILTRAFANITNRALQRVLKRMRVRANKISGTSNAKRHEASINQKIKDLTLEREMIYGNWAHEHSVNWSRGALKNGDMELPKEFQRVSRELLHIQHLKFQHTRMQDLNDEIGTKFSKFIGHWELEENLKSTGGTYKAMWSSAVSGSLVSPVVKPAVKNLFKGLPKNAPSPNFQAAPVLRSGKLSILQAKFQNRTKYDQYKYLINFNQDKLETNPLMVKLLQEIKLDLYEYETAYQEMNLLSTTILADSFELILWHKYLWQAGFLFKEEVTGKIVNTEMTGDSGKYPMSKDVFIGGIFVKKIIGKHYVGRSFSVSLNPKPDNYWVDGTLYYGIRLMDLSTAQYLFDKYAGPFFSEPSNQDDIFKARVPKFMLKDFELLKTKEVDTFWGYRQDLVQKQAQMRFMVIYFFMKYLVAFGKRKMETHFTGTENTTYDALLTQYLGSEKDTSFTYDLEEYNKEKMEKAAELSKLKTAETKLKQHIEDLLVDLPDQRMKAEWVMSRMKGEYAYDAYPSYEDDKRELSLLLEEVNTTHLTLKELQVAWKDQVLFEGMIDRQPLFDRVTKQLRAHDQFEVRAQYHRFKLR